MGLYIIYHEFQLILIDFQKAAAFINEFLLKLNEDAEGSELRDTLNLALLHMQKYYRKLQTRSHEKNAEKTLSLTARGFSPMTPFVDAPDKFQWKWVNLDNLKNLQGIMTDESMNITTLPHIMHAVKQKDSDLLMELVQGGRIFCMIRLIVAIFLNQNFNFSRHKVQGLIISRINFIIKFCFLKTFKKRDVIMSKKQIFLINRYFN